MLKRLNHIIFIILINACTAYAQQDSAFAKAKMIPGSFTDFAVDNLGNVYVLNSDNQLKKFGPAGDSLAIYNDVRKYGKIYSMDVTNPMKILLYYKEFSTIVMVDRLLAIINTIDLRSFNLYQVKAIGLAYDNNIWIYDELEAKLKRIADDGTLINATTDIRQFTDSVPDPSLICDQSGFVYLYDIQKGAYIFDHYGAFQKYMPFHGWMDFNVIDKTMLGRDEHFFYKYQQGSINAEKESIPAYCLPTLKIIVRPAALYSLNPGGIQVYTHQ